MGQECIVLEGRHGGRGQAWRQGPGMVAGVLIPLMKALSRMRTGGGVQLQSPKVHPAYVLPSARLTSTDSTTDWIPSIQMIELMGPFLNQTTTAIHGFWGDLWPAWGMQARLQEFLMMSKCTIL